MMNSLLFSVALCIGAATAPPALDIVPKPASVELREGSWTMRGETSIDPGGPALRGVAEWLRDEMEEGGASDVSIVDPNRKEGAADITLALDPSAADPGGEGYVLEVKPDGVNLRAPQPAGVFYGLQTLLQLPRRPAGGGPRTVPCMTVRDMPRFGWRGLMLDCSRTFLSMDYLHRYVDLLAMHKMNVLHLHLTDEQGWRVEIKSHPELTDIGARWDDAYPDEIYGYYSQDQLRELVKYAADRFVTIVPEIEMPSHCLPVLKAHPELSCRGEAYRIVPYMDMMKPGVTPYGVMCAGNDATFALMEDVLTELVDIFPSKYIHIGGDECPKEFWKSCPKCQARIKDEGLKDENELQSYFVKRIEKSVNAHGRTLLGWDEILEGGLAPNAAVMSWRGVEGGIAAARAGHPVVMSPTSHCYFDYDYFTTPTDKVYAYEPVPAELAPEQAKNVLGAQANMWTHLARTDKAIDEQIFPRLCALAEVVWSPVSGRSWNDFQARMNAHAERLTRQGVALHRDIVVPVLGFNASDNFTVTQGGHKQSILQAGVWENWDVMETKALGPSELVDWGPTPSFRPVGIATDKSGNKLYWDDNNTVYLRVQSAWIAVLETVRHITVSRNTIWALGAAPVAGGYDILQWTGSEWKLVSPGAAAVQISAAEGILWAVNTGGTAWKWDGTAWTAIPGTVQAIAAGPQGAVWGLRLDAANDQWQAVRLEKDAWVEVGPPLPVEESGRE